MRRDYVWVVVSSRDGRPVRVDGVYGTRAHAREVKRFLDEVDGVVHQHTVCKLTFLAGATGDWTLQHA